MRHTIAPAKAPIPESREVVGPRCQGETIATNPLFRALSLGVRPKLAVSSPADSAEAEADRVANRLIDVPGAIAGPVISRPIRSINRACDSCASSPCTACADQENGTIWRQAPGPPISPALDGRVVENLGQGVPLSGLQRAFFEPRLAADLSSVRIHHDDNAARAARQLQARAFAYGPHVAFASGEYTHGVAGQRLLAHELVHVVQQGAAPRGGVLPNQSSRESVGVESQPSMIQRQIGLDLPVEPPSMPPGWNLPEIDLPPELPPEVSPVPEITPTPKIAPTPEVTPGPQVGPFPGPAPIVGPLPDAGISPPEEGADDDEGDSECGTRHMPFTVVTGTPGPLGQGGLVEASPLSRCSGNTRGSLPSSLIFQSEFACINAAGQGGNWLRAHVLHGKTKRRPLFNLHGPGNMKWNLVIADQTLNQQMRVAAEDPVIGRVHLRNEVMWYRSKVDSYVPGRESFAQSLTVDFGRFDTTTNTKGPREGGGTFTLGHQVPNCPPGLAAGMLPGIPPPTFRAARPATTTLSFQSTFKICLRELRSRTFHVASGGVQLRIAGGWFDSSGNIPQDANSCPVREYKITLWKDNGRFWPDGEMGHLLIPVDRAAKVKWQRLVAGDYYFIVETTNRNPQCCLTGEISVATFSAPRPAPGGGVVA